MPIEMFNSCSDFFSWQNISIYYENFRNRKQILEINVCSFSHRFLHSFHFGFLGFIEHFFLLAFQINLKNFPYFQHLKDVIEEEFFDFLNLIRLKFLKKFANFLEFRFKLRDRLN